MASSVQLENGFTRIANELLDALMAHPFTLYEIKILLAIIRSTYGWGRKSSHLSYTDLSRQTRISRRHAFRVLKKLKEDRIVLVLRAEAPWRRRPNLVGIQKDPALWKGCGQKEPNASNVTSLSPGASQTGDTRGDSSVPSRGDTLKKERKRERNLKKGTSESQVIHRRLESLLKAYLVRPLKPEERKQILKSSLNLAELDEQAVKEALERCLKEKGPRQKIRYYLVSIWLEHYKQGKTERRYER